MLNDDCPGRGVRPGSVATEAWRNVTSGTSRALTFALIALIVLGGLGMGDIRATRSLVNEAEQFQQAGANVLTFTAIGAVDASACESFAELPGVLAAGAIRSTTDLLVLTALPLGPIPQFEVTPGFAAVLGADTQGRQGIILPRPVAETLGATPGRTVAIRGGGTALVAATYPFPSDGRSADLQNAVLEPRPATGAFDQCWIRSWPLNQQILGLAGVLIAHNAPSGTTISPGSLNITLGSSFNGTQAFDGRQTHLAWLIALGCGLLLGFAFTWNRRRSLASARQFGVARGAQTLQQIAEALFICIFATALSGLALAIGANGSFATSIWLLGMRVVVAGVAGILIGAGVGTNLVRAGSLSRYIKD